MLCIATPNPDSPAETFIRQHINKTAPGNTVVLYFQGDAKCLKDIPALKVPDEDCKNPLQKTFRSLINLLIHGYPGAITGNAAKIIENWFKEHRVQTVLAEFGPTGCALVPICQKLGIRLVVYFHGYDGTVMPRRWVIRHAYKNLNKRVYAFVCASRHFFRVLVNLGFDSDKIHVIPYGIELDQFEPDVEKDPNLVLAVSRFVEKKAPHLTIQAFENVLIKHPQARLEMIGGGPLLQVCKELVDARGLNEKVILHSVKDHEFVKRKMARASLFVQHSVTALNGDTESLGVTLLEAMACEVPVVATRHNGFIETVEDGVRGFLVAERDVDGMTRRIVQILKDKRLLGRMGKAGRYFVLENYEFAKVIRELRVLLDL